MKILNICLVLVLLLVNNTLFSQEKDSLKLKKYNTHFLFEFGIIYPELQFIDSQGERTLNSDAVNISSNRFAIGGGGDILVDKVKYLLTLSSNRYDIRTFYTTQSQRYPVHYFFDFASLDANLLFTLSKVPFKWKPLLKAGISFHQMISGFQEVSDYTIDLKENNDFVGNNVDFNLGLYVTKPLSDYSKFWFGYNYKLGLYKEEINTTQSYNINAQTFSLGISLSTEIFKKKSYQGTSQYDHLYQEINQLKAQLDLKQDKDKPNKKFTHFVTPDNTKKSPLRLEIKSYVDQYLQSYQCSNHQGYYPSNKLVLLFPSNETVFYPEYQNNLDSLITELKSNSFTEIRVVGYADLTGENEFNLQLSKNRSNYVSDILVINGINPTKIVREYKGATTKFDNEYLKSNRRVEIFIIP